VRTISVCSRNNQGDRSHHFENPRFSLINAHDNCLWLNLQNLSLHRPVSEL
jgi:hypothetical protein